MSEEGVEDAEVGVAESGRGEWKVEKVTDHHVDQDAEVVGVKIFICVWCGEKEIKEF